MKRLFNITFLLALLPLFISCSNDDDDYDKDSGISVAEESFPLYMAVTNNINEDLVFASDDYTKEYYGETFYFDKWNIYWGENKLQANHQEDVNAVMPVCYDNNTQWYFIRFTPDNKLTLKMRACNNKQILEYRFTSFSLFGDTELHTVHVELQRITDKNTNQSSFVEFSVSVDGVKQNVYYPESWKELHPKDSHGNEYTPYFVLNVDAL